MVIILILKYQAGGDGEGYRARGPCKQECAGVAGLRSGVRSGLRSGFKVCKLV